MNAVVIASEESDAHAAEAVEQHQAQLAGDLAHKVEMLGGTHELLGGHRDEVSTGSTEVQPTLVEEGCDGAAHVCGCGEADGPAHPELDARAIPPAIRHATIFGALDGVRPGDGLVLVAPHDPLPLLAQLERRAPSGFEVSYLERGPQTWRLALVRRAG